LQESLPYWAQSNFSKKRKKENQERRTIELDFSAKHTELWQIFEIVYNYLQFQENTPKTADENVKT